MDFVNKMQSMSDQNRDGRMSKEDLESMRDDSNSGRIDKLKAKADMNDDGRVSMDDIKSII